VQLCKSGRLNWCVLLCVLVAARARARYFHRSRCPFIQLDQSARSPGFHNDLALVRVKADGSLDVVCAQPGVDTFLRQICAREDLRENFKSAYSALEATVTCETLPEARKLLVTAKREGARRYFSLPRVTTTTPYPSSLSPRPFPIQTFSRVET